MKTAISDRVIETMVKPISLDPLSAASIGLRPSSRWRTMFSITTTASSTTNPIAVDRLDHISAGYALNRQDDGALRVVPASEQIVLRCLDCCTDIADAHGRAGTVCDDQVVVRVRLDQLIVGIERVGLLRAVQRTLRQIDVGLRQRVAHVLEADAPIGERLRIDLNPDRRLLLPANAHLADTRDLRNLR